MRATDIPRAYELFNAIQNKTQYLKKLIQELDGKTVTIKQCTMLLNFPGDLQPLESKSDPIQIEFKEFDHESSKEILETLQNIKKQELQAFRNELDQLL